MHGKLGLALLLASVLLLAQVTQDAELQGAVELVQHATRDCLSSSWSAHVVPSLERLNAIILVVLAVPRCEAWTKKRTSCQTYFAMACEPPSSFHGLSCACGCGGRDISRQNSLHSVCCGKETACNLGCTKQLVEQRRSGPLLVASLVGSCLWWFG